MKVKNRFACFLIFILLSPLTMSLVSANPAAISIESHPTSVSADQGIQFTAIVTDSSGNTIDDTVYWSASSGVIDSTGFFTPGLAGNVNITASSGNVNTTTSVLVTKGWPHSIQSNFQSLDVSVDDIVSLDAFLLDRAGNQLDEDLVYRCQNGIIDYENKTWAPATIGNSTMRIMYQELEHQVQFNVQPGNASFIEFPLGLTVQSGSTLHINVTVYDSHGNEVKLSKAGQLTFEVENGSISNTGLYYANAPGNWNVSVNSTSGAMGFGRIKVLPAQATGLDIGIDEVEIRAGSTVNLSAIRTDIFGNSGEVDLPLSNWTTPSGTLAKVNQTVQWTPSSIGTWTIGVSDQGYSTTISVNVIQGFANKIDFTFSQPIFKSGDLIIASLAVYDAAGNSLSIDGAWDISTEISSVDHGTWQELRPGPIGNYTISATWFDNETQQVFQVEKLMNIVAGDLARIILPESGTQVASDDVLTMDPQFEDEYGNILDDVIVDWIIEEEDMTMSIRLAGNKWAPDRLGIHEIRAISQGIFAITEVEVIPGIARQIFSNYNDTITIQSGDRMEIQIFTLDVNGNQALAKDVVFDFDDPSGKVIPSPTGVGYWYIEGGIQGSWNLRLSSGTAIEDLSVNITVGEAVRLIAELPEETPEEGDDMIIRIYGLDQAGNIVEVPSSEVSIQCTAGSTKHISDDTYMLTIEQAGQSQSCNALWNDLVAQRFFDVDAVLFGGGLGSTNTALTMVSIIILLFIAIMMVLIRRIRPDTSREEFWDDDYEDGVESIVEDELEKETPVIKETKEPETVSVEKEESPEDIRTRLAAEAKRTGIMQAAPGTEQGKTGWYIDSSGELTSWLVSEDGEWTRVS